jgi:hypothetical protein
MSRIADFLIEAEEAMAAGRATDEQVHAVRALCECAAWIQRCCDHGFILPAVEGAKRLRKRRREYDWAYRRPVRTAAGMADLNNPETVAAIDAAIRSN